jgi:protein subunit release factor B
MDTPENSQEKKSEEKADSQPELQPKPKPKYNTDLETLKKEVEIEFYKSGGPGGQHKNKVETAVRLRHIPSGITVIATETRSQEQNKRLAFERLQKRLERLNQVKKKRVPTKVPRAIRQEILETKVKRGETKKMRKKVAAED